MDYLGPFPTSKGNTHILVVVDYVTKWIEEIPTHHADASTSIKMIKDIIFHRFGVPRFLIADGVTVDCTLYKVFSRKYFISMG